jgi:tetratricopeptide (TPR) repeat protein
VPRKSRRPEPAPKLKWPFVVAIIVATALAYLPALSAPFVMDDIPAIDANVAIHSLIPEGAQAPGNPVAGRPVARASLAVNYAINDLLGVDQRQDPNGPYKTVGYHLLNLLIHLGTGALLFGVIRRAMREEPIPADWQSLADPIAGVTAALWLLHPIQSEVLNYVVQRTEGLASLFYIATLYCSIRAWDTESAAARLRWYVAGVVACVLALGSKEIAITIPLTIVLYDRAFRVPAWRAIVRPRSHRGWFYIALAAASIVSFVTITAGARGETAGFSTGISWSSYFYSQCWAIAHYLYLVAVPATLTVDYGNQAIHGARGIAGLILLSAFAIATLLAWTKVSRFGWFAFAGSWFFILLAPSSSFVPIGTEIAAERRVYLALAAILLLVVVGAESLRRRYAARVTSRQLFIGFGAIAVALAAGTAARSYTYSDRERLWRDAAAHAPENARAFDNLADALFHAQPPNYAAAESAATKAVALDPSCRYGCANLASVMIAQSRFAEAVPLLERTAAKDPDNLIAERRLSLALLKMGAYDRALPHLELLASKYPFEDHLVVLGVAYASLGRPADAIATLDAAVRRYPQSSLRRLGGTLDAAVRDPAALPYLQKLAMAVAGKWL